MPRLVGRTRYEVSEEDVAPLVAQAIADDDTVVLAAAAAVDANPVIATLEASTLGMPTVATTNYTRHLSRYASLAAAVADLPDAGANGGEIHIDGEIPWSTTRVIPANISLVGRGSGSTALIAPAGVSFPLLDINGASGVALHGLAFLKASGAKASGGGYAVLIRGDASDVLLDDVFADAFVSGVHAEGDAGTVAGTIRRLSLRNVRVARSSSLWGILLDNVDVATVVDSHSYENWLDGFKLRKKSHNVTLIGCSGNENGRAAHPDYGNNPASNGDGLDAYAGGDTFSLIGFTANGNSGTGAQIKTGELNQTDAATFGYVRNMNITDFNATGNTASGLALAMNDPGDMTQPVVANVTFNGGLFKENGSHGLYIAARNVVANGVKSVRNAGNGIAFSSRAMDVVINSPLVIGSGFPTANSVHGITVAGTNITLNTPTVIGRDSDTIAQESDYSGTIYTQHAISVFPGASGTIRINDPIMRHCTQNKVYPAGAIAGKLIVHAQGAGSPIGAQFGSPGSTWTQTDATGRTVRWSKVGGASNTVEEWAAQMHGAGPATGSLNFPSIAAGASETLTVGFSVAFGVAATDMAVVTPPSTLPAGLITDAWCTANTVNIRLTNVTAAPVDPPAGTWAVATIKV